MVRLLQLSIRYLDARRRPLSHVGEALGHGHACQRFGGARSTWGAGNGHAKASAGWV